MSVKKSVVKEQLANIGTYHTFGVWGEMRALHRVLNEGEVIDYLTSGFDGNRKTLLVVATNYRLLVLDSNLAIGSDDCAFPYDKINSVRGKRGIFWGSLHISTAGVSGEDRVITYVRKSDLTKMVAVISKNMRSAKE